MENIQSLTSWRKPKFILFILLITFFLRGIFLVALSPIFSGPDEPRHYNTIQYLAEPKEKTWPIFKKKKSSQTKGDAFTYNFSQEIRETNQSIYFGSEGDDLYGISDFSNSYLGKNEQIIIDSQWHKYNDLYPPDVAENSKSLYHKAASYIEKFFYSENILVRFHLARIFSLILGTFTILFCYFIAKNIGFSKKYSLILTAILSFQPKLSITFSYVTYDAALVFAFVSFTLGAVLIMRNGLNWKTAAIITGGTIIGILTKGTGVILLPIFLLLLCKKIYKSQSRKILFSILFILALFLLYIIQHKYNLLSILSINEITTIGHYLSDSFTIGRFEMTAKTYWGNLQWSSNIFYDFILYFIWAIEIISVVGVAISIFSKKKIEFLPEKKYILFFLGMLIALQLGIRFYDWRIFSRTGGFDLGTPGRYFLPNIASHIILVFCGLGALLKKEKYFDISLKIGLLFMFFFWFYLIINVVAPRYYM